MFSKAPKYFYDQEAIRNPPSEALIQQVMDGYGGSDTKDYDAAGAQSASGTKARIIENARKKIKVPGGWDKSAGAHGTIHRGGRTDALYAEAKAALGSNKRSVWTVAPKPFKEAHFATFPPDLIEPCILAGCPVGGAVLDPFGGAGTTGLVAQRNGRDAILIELNPAYMEIARRRLAGDSAPKGKDKQAKLGKRQYSGFNKRWNDKETEAQIADLL
jgi:DNA modification methylase